MAAAKASVKLLFVFVRAETVIQSEAVAVARFASALAGRDFVEGD